MDGLKGNGRLDKDAILDDIRKILHDMTSDWEMAFADAIGPETRLMADLTFESIDVVQLAVAIEEHFNRSNLPFQKLLMTADGRYVDDLRLSELVNFVYTQLNNP